MLHSLYNVQSSVSNKIITSTMGEVLLWSSGVPAVPDRPAVIPAPPPAPPPPPPLPCAQSGRVSRAATSG
jgi:hypothetical protein